MKAERPGELLRNCRSAFFALGVASALISILYLTGSFYMLEVYDRVLPSHSIPSLIAISFLAALLYAFQCVFEVIRGRLLTRIAAVLDEGLSRSVFRALVAAPLRVKIYGDGLQALRDFDQVKSFVSSSGPAALFDLPWLPIYIAVCFLFHPAIGVTAIAGALILLLLTFLTNRGTQKGTANATEAISQRNAFAKLSQRNAEVAQSMGMMPGLVSRWEQVGSQVRGLNTHVSDVVNQYGAISKMFRMAIQSGVLAVGAVLVIEGKASAGIIIAGSILSARALAPVELAIGNWRNLVAARQSWRRLDEFLVALREHPKPMALSAPKMGLRLEGVSSGPPSAGRIIVQDVSFSVSAGSALGVIGPSGSGKSSLVRAILGLWPLQRGAVRLDGAALDQWGPDELGSHLGYLPQDVELFGGTVAQNIARFSEPMEPEAIVRAAQAAGVHDLILRLPNGYGTEIGEGGSALSAGQRQRIALARALFGDPFLVVLDEPNSNLDAEGDFALSEAITGVRKRGGIVIVIAHRASSLESVDLVLMMSDGRAQAMGPKEQVLAAVLRQGRPQQSERGNALKVVRDEQGENA
jgi:ATP-binding cassette subfamily C protein PrsD